jgi:hypothetical protein
MPAPLAAPSSKCAGPDDSDFSVTSSSSFPLLNGKGEGGPPSRSRLALRRQPARPIRVARIGEPGLIQQRSSPRSGRQAMVLNARTFAGR